MLKIIVLNIFMFIPYVYDNIIFLETPNTAITSFTQEFNLNEEDIRYVRYYFLNKKYFNFKNLPKNTSRKSVDKYFQILKNMEHEEWKKAYLYLLTIVPELFIEDEIGC